MTVLSFDAPGGGDAALAQLLVGVVSRHAAADPRSLQSDLGPSEIGHPCPRRIALRLTGAPVSNVTDPWASIVGTAVHAWLADAFVLANRDEPAMVWDPEGRVEVADGLSGTCDLWHDPSRTVVDHKVVGPEAMRRVRAEGPGEQYRAQVHAYGVGWLRRGRVPARVAIAFWPRSGRLDGLYVWSEPFDPAVAADALTRLAGIRSLVAAAGCAAVPLLPRVEDMCLWCDYHRPGAPVTATDSCPGPDSPAQVTAPPSAAVPAPSHPTAA